MNIISNFGAQILGKHWEFHVSLAMMSFTAPMHSKLIVNFGTWFGVCFSLLISHPSIGGTFAKDIVSYMIRLLILIRSLFQLSFHSWHFVSA